MQMGVEVAVVSQPLNPAQVRGLKLLEQITPTPGGVEGTGSAYILSRQTNASFQAINDVLVGGGQVSFSKGETKTSAGSEAGAIVIAGLDRNRVDEIARMHSVRAIAAAKVPL